MNDYDAQAWTGIGVLTLPVAWGSLSGASSTTVAWLGAPAASCAAYPQADVFFHPPVGYRAGVGTDSPFAADASVPTGCAARVSADVPPWVRYRL